MGLFHLRLTQDSFPQFIRERFTRYVLVSHQQETFHFHIVGELLCAEKTFRNLVSSKFTGNKCYSIKKCDVGMVKYLFHPGSNWSNYQTDYLTDVEKLEAIASSEAYYNALKSGSDHKDVPDQIIALARVWLAAEREWRSVRVRELEAEGQDIRPFLVLTPQEVRNAYKRGLYQLIVSTKKLCPTAANIQQYLRTCYIREGLMSLEEFMEICID